MRRFIHKHVCKVQRIYVTYMLGSPLSAFMITTWSLYGAQIYWVNKLINFMFQSSALMYLHKCVCACLFVWIHASGECMRTDFHVSLAVNVQLQEDTCNGLTAAP